MNSEIIVALIAFVGTLCGTFGGIIASARLTAYRLSQLEKKVDKHNNFAERIPIIEERVEGLGERVIHIEERI